MDSDKDNRTPEQMEAAKTRKERAADVAYTINHTIVCTATDFIDPYIGNYIQKSLGNKSQLSNTWAAEIIGDFGAVPLTIGMQRFFPGVMNSISKLAEPVFHKAFKNGAQRDAKAWAQRHGFSEDSKEYKERAERIYKYEVQHIPQAIMWTGSSIVLNVGAQRMLGNKAPIHHIVAGKIGGAALTAGITIGARSMFPRNAEKLDKFTSEKFLLPVEEKLDDLVDADSKGKNWSKRIKPGKDRESNIQNMI